MPRLRTFLRLRWAERIAFARAWCFLVAAKLGIRHFGLRRTLNALAPEPRVAPDRSWPLAARWLPVAVRYFPNGGHCLGRSVALVAILRRAGIPCDLRIGVRQGTADIEAHAWVEVDGHPVNDVEDIGEHYRSFEAIGLK